MENNTWNPEIDTLTGLNNRVAFYKHAKELIDRAPEADYMLIISDIENFKMINIRYGEEMGDALLAYVGQSLSGFNGEGFLFARYSGDQFVGIVRKDENNHTDDFGPMMAGMEVIYKHAPVSHFEVKFGIYDNVDKKLSVSLMCDRAMMALRTIKHQYGRSVAIFDQAMRLQYLKEQSIQECMEQALSDNQFKVYYQPKHDAQSGQLIGAEALVRWIHPEYGFMSPADFLPIFEKNGFISTVDRFVYQTVVADQTRWLSEGYRIVPVSVNASRRDLLKDNFISEIEAGIVKNQIPVEYIHMEITESVFMEDIYMLNPIITRVREMGIKVELDDFGSGFSALSMLAKLPLDVIKLDKSFIDNIAQQKIVIENVIKMCHDLNYNVTAEGVETKEQLDELARMNCDVIQGYYYSKPIPATEFEAYMKKFA